MFGTVTDSSGAAVNGAKVSILNADTNTTVNTETNGEGYYTSPPLIVGNYEVDVEQPGFKKEIRRGIVLQVDQHAQINVQLQIGAVGESVQVTAEAPLVNTYVWDDHVSQARAQHSTWNEADLLNQHAF